MSPGGLIAIITAYLVGSIPFGYLVARARGVDLTKMGSGNIGATNVYRALGLKTALGVFALDVAKGFAGTRVIPLLTRHTFETSTFNLICGLAVILGAVGSVFMRFKGGKGVASGVGVFLGLAPLATAMSLGIWAIVVSISRYVSLGSLIGAIALPMLVAILGKHGATHDPVFYLAVVIMIIVIIRHRSNIRRLVNGTESKIGRSEPG